MRAGAAAKLNTIGDIVSVEKIDDFRAIFEGFPIVRFYINVKYHIRANEGSSSAQQIFAKFIPANGSVESGVISQHQSFRQNEEGGETLTKSKS